MSKNLIGPLCHERNPHDLDFLLHLDNNCGPTHLSSQSSFYVETKKKRRFFGAQSCLFAVSSQLHSSSLYVANLILSQIYFAVWVLVLQIWQRCHFEVGVGMNTHTLMEKNDSFFIFFSFFFFAKVEILIIPREGDHHPKS